MLVKNNLPTVLDFGNWPNGTTLHAPGTKNHGFFIPAIQLLPGINPVDKEAWDMWTTGRAASKGAGGKPAGLNWHLQEKNVEVVKVETEADEGSGQSIVTTVSSEDFTDLGAGDAIAIVKETFDLQMLEAWGEAESEEKDRTTVLNAITSQIEMLGAQASDTTDDG
jgi:hypothetical protein